MTLEEQFRLICQRQDGARRAGNLRLLHALGRERVRCEQALKREVERQVADALVIAHRDARWVRKFMKAGGFLGSAQRERSAVLKFRRDLQDLGGFEAPAVGRVSADDRHKLIVKHLRAKRAGRIAVKGGEGRGKQKQQQAQPRNVAVKAMLKQGMTTRAIADKTGLSQRRVQQLKKRN